MQESNQNYILKSIDPFEKKEEIREIWTKLQARAVHSFFTSWGWVDTWIDSLPRDFKARVLVGTKGQQDILCCVMVERAPARYEVFRKNRAHLHATGDSTFDALTVEYNGVLIDHNYTDLVAIFADPCFAEIEEFSFPGIYDLRRLNQYCDRSFYTRISAREPCYFVNLDEVRRRDETYLECLSANSRSQVRRSLRRLQKHGEVRVTAAGSVPEALLMLDRLSVLHQREWTARGEPGAFATEYFVQFHQELIRRRYSHGEIQLLEVKAGEVVVGYIYNFLYMGEVLFYQSGFNYEKLKDSKPGIVSHYLVIERCLELGHKKYNFLAGDAQYKRSLATEHDDLYWVVASRKNTKSRLEYFLRFLKRKRDRLIRQR